MEAITRAFAVRGYAVRRSPNFLAVFDSDTRSLVATVAPFGGPNNPPTGERAKGQHYGATMHRGRNTGDLVKYRPGDDVDDFARRVIGMPPIDRSAH